MFNFMRLPPLRRLMLMKAITGGGSWSTISGNPVSFTAKAAPLRKLQVAFSPKQDLHGYDHPWPAGGGKNKFNKGGTDTDNGYVANAYLSYLGKVSTPGSGTWFISEYIPIGADVDYAISGLSASDSSAPSICFYNSSKEFISGVSYQNRTGWTNKTPADTAFVRLSAGPTTAVTNAIQFELGSSATSYAPYSNICPISGWSSLGVEQRGKNLWDEVTQNGYYNLNGVFIPNASYIASKNPIAVKPSTEYNIHCDSMNIGRICFYDKDGVFVSTTSASQAVENQLVTTPSKAYYMAFDMSSGYGAVYKNDISINYPSTDHSYHAYNPSSRSISISLGSTYYSGTVDVVTGVGEITWAAVDMGSLSWTYVSAFDCFTALVGRDDYRAKDAFSAKCSSYPFVWAYTNLTDKSCAYIYNVHVAVKDTAYGTDANAFGTAMSGVQLVYELATPIPISLTPQEVNSLAGDNTMWSNANQPITVTYRSN